MSKRLLPTRSTLIARGCFLGASLLALMSCNAASQMAWAADDPFKISVDGEEVDGAALPAAKPLEKSGGLDIQVKADALGLTPHLNVSTVPPRASFRVGDEVKFLASLNYADWISKAEVRIYKRGMKTDSSLLATIPLEDKMAAVWQVPADLPEEMAYVLRVYDAEGRFDETQPLPISITAKDLPTHDDGEKAAAPGYSEDRTAFRNIPLSGGAVTVYGRKVPQGYDVVLDGDPVPVDPDGNFVVQRLLPAGQHQVDVEVKKGQQAIHIRRDVNIPENDWFFVGMADVVAEGLFGKIERANPNDFGEDPKTRGRLAFYLKGKIKGSYILTAAADTSETGLKNLFKGWDGKDPREFLKRIDPDDYYPVYGDDSTSVEDAPTRGKFYVKLQNGPSHIMWGNFKVNIAGTELLRNERALYGAQASYSSSGVAADGTPKTTLNVHAALPGTLPQRDNLRGTGGSAYFLKHMDITSGSETVVIETRNAVTGWVTQRKTLKYGTDYDFDYIQGVLLLREPLQSSNTTGTENFVVASYEYTPSAADVQGFGTAGRAQQWVGNHVRVGVTGSKEPTANSTQKMVGADIRLRGESDDTYVEAEVARSQGPGFDSSYSADGGLTLQDQQTTGSINKKAEAFRVEGRASLSDVTGGKLKGSLGARYENYGKGYSSLETNADEARQSWGVEGDVELSEKAKAAASFSEKREGDDRLDRQALAKLNYKITDSISVEPYGRYTEKELGSSATATSKQGKRGDVGLRLAKDFDDDRQVSVFGETTAKRTGTMLRDDRVGVGAKTRLTEKIKLEGETSYGTQGIGAAATISYEPTVDDRYYLGYKLDPSRDVAENWPFQLVGRDLGTIVAGARRRIDDRWETFAEDNYDAFGERTSLTQAYGVTFTPDAKWTFTGGAEIGHVVDNTTDSSSGKKNPDFDRKAFSAGVGYKSEDGLEGRVRGEYRIDDSEDDTRDVTSYLIRSSGSAKLNGPWRALASLDAVVTDSTTTTRKGKYVEGSAGVAYRPQDNDRLNLLAKYTYLYDMPGDDQQSVDGSTSSPAQLSHIISADISYDLNPKLTLGAKYGARFGKLRERVAGADWEKSVAHLGVIRADLHIVNQYDFLVEGRMLWSPTTDQTDYGAVAAVYRHLGDNFKAGVGYNFGRFSDDLRDVTLNDYGMFVNVIGTF